MPPGARISEALCVCYGGVDSHDFHGLETIDGAVKDFNFAACLKSGQVLSTQFLLTPDPNVTYSACLMHKAEQMFETGTVPYPVERTLLTSGILDSCLTSKVQNHAGNGIAKGVQRGVA